MGLANMPLTKNGSQKKKLRNGKKRKRKQEQQKTKAIENKKPRRLKTKNQNNCPFMGNLR